MKSSNKTLVLNIYDTLSGAINSQISLINNLCDLLSMQQYNFNLNANGRILDLVLSSKICKVSTSCDPVVVEDSHHPSLLINIPRISCGLFSEDVPTGQSHKSYDLKKRWLLWALPASTRHFLGLCHGKGGCWSSFESTLYHCLLRLWYIYS